MKAKTLLLAAVLILMLSAAAYPQATLRPGSEPVSNVIVTGITEKAGDITFDLLSGTPTQGTITINYGVKITNPAVSDAANVDITGGITATYNALASDLPHGVLVLDVPAQAIAPPARLRITGILLDIAEGGFTISSPPLEADLSSVNNSLEAGHYAVRVVRGFSQGITAEAETLVVNSVIPVGGDAYIDIKEGFLNAFGPVDMVNYTPGRLGVMISLDQIPDGMKLTFYDAATTDSGNTFSITDAAGAAIGGNVDMTVDTAPMTIIYMLDATSDPNLVETLQIHVGVDVGTTKYVGSLPVNAKVTLFMNVANSTTSKTKVPRYLTSWIDLGPLVDITGATTLLCVPFAQVQPAIQYDTGLGIANTTLDPGHGAGKDGADLYFTPQPGTIDFWFYPNGGDAPFKYSTMAGSPGAGLDVTGKVPAGGTYSVLVSQLMDAARATNTAVPLSFSGYIFALTNFSGAHGIYTVSNFSTFSQGGQILVTNRNGPPAEWWNN